MARLNFSSAQCVTVKQNCCHQHWRSTAGGVLGVYLESKQLSMWTHTTEVMQTGDLCVRLQIWHLLGHDDITANVVKSLTRLHYGNALFSGLLYSTIAPLQHINAAMRRCMVCSQRTILQMPSLSCTGYQSVPRHSSSLVYRALNGQLPSYISDLLQYITTWHPNLWSADNDALLVSQTSLTFGEQA